MQINFIQNMAINKNLARSFLKIKMHDNTTSMLKLLNVFLYQDSFGKYIGRIYMYILSDA